MFSLVEIQESFPNLNDIEGFNKLFKKSPSAFAESRASAVHNVWVLPGHIIISLDEGQKLCAHDLLPKQSPWPISNDFLRTTHNVTKKGQNNAVLEVFCIGAPMLLHMFIVLKSGKVLVWKFIRPSFEWQFVNKFNLSVSKNIQITSLCFDKKSNLLFWCERRTPTQCCVCSGKIKIDSGKDMLSEKSDILHNCPPVQMFLVGPSGVLLRPMANSPAGIAMYWSQASKRIQLQLWNYLHNGFIPLSASTDFQSLVTESLSLWINESPNNPTIIACCTHPVTQELFILESTCNIYTCKMDASGKPSLSKVCSLCKARIGEISPRKGYTIFAFKKFLGVLLEEHELFVFEMYTGRLVWEKDFSKQERIRSWVSQGDIPQVGVWCPSFMYMIRSESVMKQAETMLRLDVQKPVEEKKLPEGRRTSKEYTLHLTFKGSHGKTGTETYIVVDQEDEDQSSGGAKDGVNKEKICDASADHTVSESVMLVAEYLKDWGTKNLSREVCMSLLNHPKLMGDVNLVQFRNDEQFEQFFDMFENPCISLALLQKHRKHKPAVDDMVSKFIHKNKGKDVESLGPGLQALVEKYNRLSQDIQEISKVDESKVSKEISTPILSFSETFELQLLNDNLSKKDFNGIIQWAAEVRPLEFISEIKAMLQLDSVPENGVKDEENFQTMNAPTKLQLQLWKNILRKDTNTFDIICTQLWKHSPTSLVAFVKMAHNVTTMSDSNGFLQISRRYSFASLADITRRAIDSLLYRANEQKVEKERVNVLVELLLITETLTGITEACKLLLANGLYSEAIDLLDSDISSPPLNDRLFFMILTTLIEKSSFAGFSARLCERIPENFTADELFTLMKAFEDHTNSTDVFVSGKRSTSLGDIEPLLSVLCGEGKHFTSENVTETGDEHLRKLML